MKCFSYICADSGVPIPGRKGASIHVASVCRALGRAGLSGEVLAARAEGDVLEEFAVRRLPARPAPDDQERQRIELGSFLDGCVAAPSSKASDFIYERYSLWHVGGLLRARELGIPLILEVNSPLPDEAARFRGLRQKTLADDVARLLMREADGVVCVSEEVAAWVRAHRGNAGAVWVVPNGVDPELFSPQDRSRPPELPQDAPLIAFSGSFRPWHAVDDLLAAFRNVVADHAPSAHLVCVGDGPLRVGFEASADATGLADRVHCTGAIPHEEVPDWLRGADVAVAPYGKGEPFYFSPLKIFEFLALGLPVVASDIGQIAQVMPHGKRGLLYSPGSVEELARAIGSLLDDRSGAAKLAQAGRGWALANATWSRRVRGILDHIRTLTEVVPS